MSSLDDWLVGQGSRICNCLTPWFRRVAHIGSKVRTNPPSSAKFPFFVSCSLTSTPCLVITRRLRSSNKASEQIRKPSSSKESTSTGSPLEEEQRSHCSKSICDWTQFYSRVRHRALTCKKRCGRGRLRFRQVAYLKNGNGAIDRIELRLPEALSERHASDGSRQNGLRTPHRRTEVKNKKKCFCVPCALFHRSRGQASSVGQLITKPMTNWTRASTTLKENAVSKTHRESVRDAVQLQKDDPSVAGTEWC